MAAAYVFVPKFNKRFTYFAFAFLAALIRIATVFYLYRNGTDNFGTDGLLYHEEGIKIAAQLSEGVPFYRIEYSYTWYTVFIGIIYYLTGVNRYVASFINIIITFYAAIILLRLAVNQKYGYRNSAFISLSFLYFPNLILWTSDTRKEALLIFLAVSCWYCVQRLILDVEKNKPGIASNLIRVALICLLIWLCTLVRIYMFIPMALGIIVSILLQYKQNSSYLCIILIMAVLVSSIAIFFAAVNPLTQDYHAISYPEEPTGNITKDINIKITTIKSIAAKRNLLISVIKYMLLPYPGLIEIADIHDNFSLQLLVSADMIFWYLCLAMMVSGILSAIKNHEGLLLGLLAYTVAYIVINAMIVENVSDTIYRYRSVIVGTSLLFINMGVFKKMLPYHRKYTNVKTGIIKAKAAGSFSIKN